MNFIWEIALQARENGISENDLFFQQAAECSPWYEQSFSCINVQEVCSPTVEINGLYRFSDIFQDLLHEMGGTALQRYLFDAVIHLILDCELLAGISLRDLYIQKLLQELCDNTFGKPTAAICRTLSPNEQRVVASLLLTHPLCWPSGRRSGFSIRTVFYINSKSSQRHFCFTWDVPRQRRPVSKCSKSCFSLCNIRSVFFGPVILASWV